MGTERPGMNTSVSTPIAIFFCQQIDPDQDRNRRPLEKELGPRIRFYPLPCSSRVGAGDLLKVLEAGVKKVFLVTCPNGTCRYRVGNVRAQKRSDLARKLIREIGLDPRTIETVSTQAIPISIDTVIRQLLRDREC